MKTSCYTPATHSPLVSVVLLARTLSDCAACLDMLGRQSTTFDTEVLVVDRSQDDGIEALCRRRGATYPHRLRYRRNPERYIAFGRPGAGISGRYVAVCRDDERWNDSRKLQRQGDYLREHPSCAVCFHNVEGDAALPWYDTRRYDEADMDFMHLLRHYSPLFRLEGTPGEYDFLLYERHGGELYAHRRVRGALQCLAGVSSRVAPRSAVVAYPLL